MSSVLMLMSMRLCASTWDWVSSRTKVQQRWWCCRSAHHNKYGMMRHSAFDVCSSKTTGSYESHSCGRHGFTIRGWTNTTRGVLRHDVVEKTQIALQALMEFLHPRKLGLANSEDASAVLDQIQALYPGGIVPFYRFAPAVKSGELFGKISWPNVQQTPTLQHWWFMNL